MKKLPKFKSEAEERRFWQEHDTMDYIDWSDAEATTLPKLKRYIPCPGVLIPLWLQRPEYI